MTKRTKKRKRIGLALGGGAVRGMAHIGVLEVLERERIPVDVIAGTSVGALVGALYCAGMSAAELAYIGSHFRWRHFARPVWSRYGLISFEPIGTLLNNLIGDITFDQLDIPFAAVAADIETGEMVTLDRGPVAPAVVASSSVPGLVVPIELNGRHLCDGGIVNNLPVSVARSMGADYIIAVDIFEPKYGRHKNPLAMGFLALEILIDRAGMGYESADCLIRPDLAGRSYHRFDRREELRRCGVNACETVLPELQTALRELDAL